MSAEILQVGENLMHRCYIILQAMYSGFPVDTKKFRHYCIDTARLYVELYNWYPIPTAVHKVLIHGYQIIAHAELPIGQLSEDAQESRNKDIKKFREAFARKTSRTDNLQDIFNRLLVS